MDWKIVISELMKAGWTQAEIGKAVGKSQAWVSAVRRGLYKDILWHDGERLRKLHARVMRRQKKAKGK